MESQVSACVWDRMAKATRVLIHWDYSPVLSSGAADLSKVLAVDLLYFQGRERRPGDLTSPP